MFRMLLAALLALAGPAVAQVPAPTAEAEIAAIGGYDPVAYFAGKPMPGTGALTAVHDGLTYRFANAANRDAFVAAPARHAPQFGGHCAWAASQGRLAKPDPTIWKIVDGKLYLNCSKDAEVRWLADVPGNIKKAEAFWELQELGGEP